MPNLFLKKEQHVFFFLGFFSVSLKQLGSLRQAPKTVSFGVVWSSHLLVLWNCTHVPVTVQGTLIIPDCPVLSWKSCVQRGKEKLRVWLLWASWFTFQCHLWYSSCSWMSVTVNISEMVKKIKFRLICLLIYKEEILWSFINYKVRI